jgi:signal transduction histidine kinase
VSQPPLAAAIEEGIGSFVAARFEAKGNVLGVLNIANQRPTPFSQRDGELLQSFANLAAIAVENARLYERVQDLAVLEERQRIGMDLHDGVIQSIYAAGLNLEDCAEDVYDNPSEVRGRLDKAIGDLNRVIQDIRAYIYDLRPEVAGGEDIREPLKELLREVKVNTLMETDLMVEGEPPRLSEEQATNLIHIAQEALTNVKKHARASSVKARLHTENGFLRLTIIDNGVGFDPAEAMTPAQQGLRNMAERARALGGRFSLDSARGKGTSLEVDVPLVEGGEA